MIRCVWNPRLGVSHSQFYFAVIPRVFFPPCRCVPRVDDMFKVSRCLLSLLVVGLAVLIPRTGAGQVARMGLAEMVAAADVIVRATVVSQRSEWITTRDDRVIVTLVTLRIERTLKGESRPQMLLELLGGTVGDETVHVSGVPRFAVGDRAVVLAYIGRRMVSPVVGGTLGRFPIRSSPDGAVELVTLSDGRAFASFDQVRTPLTVSPVPIPTMTLLAFEDEIIRQVGVPAGARN